MICSAADNYCAENVESIYDDVLNRDEYDIRELEPDPFPPEFYVQYLNTPEVQTAIGAVVNFSEFSPAVSNAFNLTGDDGREDGTVEDMSELLKQGVTVMMYTGDADYNCNWYLLLLLRRFLATEVLTDGFLGLEVKQCPWRSTSRDFHLLVTSISAPLTKLSMAKSSKPVPFLSSEFMSQGDYIHLASRAF